MANWTSIVCCVGFLLDGLVSALIVYALQTYRDEQKDLRAKIDSQEKDLHQMAAKLVDERFRAMSHQLNGSVQAFSATLQLLQKRLEDGDEEFDRLGEHGHQSEMKFTAKLGEFRESVLREFATRADLDKHQTAMDQKLGGLSDWLRQIDRSLTAIAAKGS